MIARFINQMEKILLQIWKPFELCILKHLNHIRTFSWALKIEANSKVNANIHQIFGVVWIWNDSTSFKLKRFDVWFAIISNVKGNWNCHTLAYLLILFIPSICVQCLFECATISVYGLRLFIYLYAINSIRLMHSFAPQTDATVDFSCYNFVDWLLWLLFVSNLERRPACCRWSKSNFCFAFSFDSCFCCSATKPI